MKRIMFSGLMFVCAAASALDSAFFAGDDAKKRIALFDRNQEVIWEYPVAQPYCMQVLQNGNILTTTGRGVIELNREKEVVWSFYRENHEIYGAARVADITVVADCTAGEVLFVDQSGQISGSFKTEPHQRSHLNMRNLTVTPQNTILVAHIGLHQIREYDAKGKLLNKYAVSGLAYRGERLENGNTLVGHEKGITEFDAAGKVVREVKGTDNPTVGTAFGTFACRMPDGHTVGGNWFGHKGSGKVLYELDADMNPVWFLPGNQIGNATAFVPVSGKVADYFRAAPEPAASVEKIRPVFGFETGDLQGWQIVSGEFGRIVTDRAVFHLTGQPYNKVGKFYLSTLETPDNRNTDSYTGELHSPPFVLHSPEMNFLVGGGKAGVYVALCDAEGNEIRRAAGDDAETMRRTEWNVPELVGQQVFLKIVDATAGGWGHITFDDFQADAEFDAELMREWRRQAEEKRFGGLHRDLTALRDAIADLSATFPDRYPAEFVAISQELNDIDEVFESLLERAVAGDEKAFEEAETLAKKYEKTGRDALLANPLLSDHPVLFVSRRQYKRDHHNTATIFQKGEINERSYDPPGKLKILTPATGDVKTLVDAGPTGIARDPELSWDGGKVIFSMRRSVDDDYHIYEVNVDGTGLKQLTSLSGVSDIDPVYLPDGKIVFSSTREPKFCMCNRHIMANLYRMDGDGANIHQIGKSTLFEGHSTVMEDGRILYDRWEYVDRAFGDAQGLWVVNPDGTMHAIFYGNNTASPGGVLDGRQIPGSHKVISTFSSCHDRPWGALAIIDRNKGVDGEAPVEHIWPPESRSLIKSEGWSPDLFMSVRPRYEDPFPLADPQSKAGAGKYFLCARTIQGNDERTGIYLIDIFGNEVLVHEEQGGFGCFDPMPIVKRKTPLSRPELRDFKNRNGKFYVQDVYIGTHMKGVERGEVKYLRVVESPEKRSWSTGASWGGQGAQFPAMNWHSFENKRILGTVPVEEDGSAYFECPSDTFVFFQLLDKDGKMIQSMRSGTIIQSGELQGCVGCHENRVGTPPASAKGLQALERPATPPGKAYGAGRMFNYMAEVQPVFDKHCVTCHDFGNAAGGLNLAGDKEFVFNASYADLWRKKLINLAGGGQAPIKEAKSWGSHASKLSDYLNGHGKARLTPEEKFRIYTWMDLNGVYYPYYECAYQGNWTGRNPLNNQQMGRLGQLCKLNFGRVYGWSSHPGAWVSFDRPELSPCLEKLEKGSPEYNEALAIIRAGAEALKNKPRADMPGFVPSTIDQQRNEKYEKLERKEEAFREALKEGRKIYDSDVSALNGKKN